ncbi:MAG: hypothetical protein ACOCV1_06765 [Bacillota bacterium]
MNNNKNKLSKFFKTNPLKSIIIAGILAFISLIFVLLCLYIIFKEAYTTSLNCNGNICVISRQDILEIETEQYRFNSSELKNVELLKSKNMFGQEFYYINLKNKLIKNENYALTPQTNTEQKQYKYLNKINRFLQNQFINTLYIENSRYQLKFIGLSAAAAGSLIFLFSIIDCIKALLVYRRKLASKYDYIIKPRSYF